MPHQSDGAQQQQPAGLVMHQIAAVLSLAGQSVFVLLQLWQGPSRSLAGAHLAAAGLVAMTALMFKWPEGYWRNRSWLLAAMRIALFSLPSFRRSGVGTALMLNHEPRPGLRGAVKDWGRIILGTRLASCVIPALALPQRPTVTLATQAVLAVLISNAPAYCSCRLLAAPVTQQRMAALASGLECASLPLMAIAPSGVHWTQGTYHVLDGAADGRALCHAMMCFLNTFVGVVLPTLVACRYRWPLSRQPAMPASQAAGPASWRSHWSGLVHRCSELAATVDGWLVAVAGSHHGGIWSAFVWWHTAVVSWWICRISAGIV